MRPLSDPAHTSGPTDPAPPASGQIAGHATVAPADVASRARQGVVAYALTALVFLAMDAVWLTSTNERLYRPAIGHLMSPTVDWTAAGLFYALYFAGLVYFAVSPALAARRPVLALARGAFIGLLAYGAYDFTNQATLRDWPWPLTIIDLAWGAVVSGVSSGVAAALALATSRPPRRTSGR
ncbi:hypothetical protein CDN99_24345 [Roseateles aquatilis]|uniref:DUF2177 domain-containing protein n=1 Tax=Roseateles aquatilis TaxID=431061 RepID=A0A246IWK0_9BURK|nr:DUF2177 family protein [Roseateles aquatilis]OWQ84427.1 hypothetical protein CDN99_24345 [Roseateles aquatilis]